jgi:hypothetical protein
MVMVNALLPNAGRLAVATAAPLSSPSRGSAGGSGMRRNFLHLEAVAIIQIF